MQFYNKTIDEIHGMQKLKDMEFIRLSMRSLAESLVNHAKDWMKSLGKLLNEQSKQSLFDLKAKLEVLILAITCFISAFYESIFMF